MVDLKTPFTLDLSRSPISPQLAVRLHCPDDTVTWYAEPLLLHDLGRVTIASHVWERPRR